MEETGLKMGLKWKRQTFGAAAKKNLRDQNDELTAQLAAKQQNRAEIDELAAQLASAQAARDLAEETAAEKEQTMTEQVEMPLGVLLSMLSRQPRQQHSSLRWLQLHRQLTAHRATWRKGLHNWNRSSRQAAAADILAVP